MAKYQIYSLKFLFCISCAAIFYTFCKQFDVKPAEVCFSFGFNITGVISVVLSTTKPEKVKPNIEMATKQVAPAFWQAMVEAGLLEADIIK